MGYTIAEKILAAHLVDGPHPVDGPHLQDGTHTAGQVWPGKLVEVQVDMVLANDITAPIAIREFARIGVDKVFDRTRIALVPDHFAPNKDIKAAEQCKMLREFAKKYGIVNYFEVGRMGIEHVILPDYGLVLPGDVVVGADSHTCTYGAVNAFATGMGSTDIAVAMATGSIWMKVPETIKITYYGQLKPWVGGKDLILYTIGLIGVEGARYKAIEFTGPAIDALPMSGRLTMSNMAIEAGGKAGLFGFDEATRAYVDARAKRPYTPVAADPNAAYVQEIEIDASQIELQVSFPHLPSNARPVGQASAIKIDQAVIGSCTNGRWDDLVVAAEILRGRQVHPDVRCIILPGSQEIYLRAMNEGLAQTFVEAGAAFSTPTCGPCLGGHMGVLAAGERCVSTTNRNFVGRMGHVESEVYLANPAVAAASAVLGYIASPQDVN
ncbi:MAG: 3-isopropylmalate dehydratase large subunit [Anaerolineae bacterium]|nr:3-isopropylmalate dehydratase large subunit [Anaerolineae bacterium]